MSAPLPRPSPPQLSSFSSGVQTIWDSTSITLAMTCPRKYYYSALRGLRRAPREGLDPAGAPGKSVHLWFGGHYAAAIEYFYHQKFDGLSHDEALIATLRRLLVDTWNRDTGAPIDYEDPKKNRETLVRSVIWYLDHYRDDPLQPIRLADGKPAVELTFKIPISDTFTLSGHLDRLAEMGGEPYVVDQKTTSTTPGAYYYRQFKPDNQMTGYTLAGRLGYNIPVRGVVIDAAQIAVGFTNFQRGFTNRSENELNEWLEDVVRLADEFQSRTAHNNFPMNRTACSNYGGCVFREICASPPHIRESIISADYIEGQFWDAGKAR